MQTAAERYGISCFHKPVLINNCSDDLLDRRCDFGTRRLPTSSMARDSAAQLEQIAVGQRVELTIKRGSGTVTISTVVANIGACALNWSLPHD